MPLTVRGEHDCLRRLGRDVHRDQSTAVVPERFGDQLSRGGRHRRGLLARGDHEYCARALDHLVDEDSLPELIAMLEDPDPSVRADTLHAPTARTMAVSLASRHGMTIRGGLRPERCRSRCGWTWDHGHEPHR